MTGPSALPNCPNPQCSQSHVIGNGSSKGRRRYQCRGCGRFFGETEGTPMYGLHTPGASVAKALLIVMRRGSLRAAEEITGHKDETLGPWLRRASAHAEALTAIAACASGRIGDDLVERAVTLTLTRTHRRPLTWCSDGWRGYASILTGAYRQPVRVFQARSPCAGGPSKRPLDSNDQAS